VSIRTIGDGRPAEWNVETMRGPRRFALRHRHDRRAPRDSGPVGSRPPQPSAARASRLTTPVTTPRAAHGGAACRAPRWPPFRGGSRHPAAIISVET
jgi:hypothetical protein